jgi:uncharacterized membrane protein
VPLAAAGGAGRDLPAALVEAGVGVVVVVAVVELVERKRE